MKTIYRFYRLCDIENENNKRWKDYSVYAYTDNKEYAKRFMNTRNMDSLRLVKSKMTKEQYVAYCNTFRTSELSEYKYLTLDNKKNKWVNILMITTWYEYEKVSEVLAEGFGRMFEGIVPPTILNDNYKKLLAKLQYIQQWACYQPVYDGEFEDAVPNLTIDMVMLLLSYFNDTF